MRLAVRSRLGDWNSYQHFDLDLSDRSDFRGKRDRELSLKATACEFTTVLSTVLRSTIRTFVTNV